VRLRLGAIISIQLPDPPAGTKPNKTRVPDRVLARCRRSLARSPVHALPTRAPGAGDASTCRIDRSAMTSAHLRTRRHWRRPAQSMERAARRFRRRRSGPSSTTRRISPSSSTEPSGSGSAVIGSLAIPGEAGGPELIEPLRTLAPARVDTTSVLPTSCRRRAHRRSLRPSRCLRISAALWASASARRRHARPETSIGCYRKPGR
jgi:hypothetical protein